MAKSKNSYTLKYGHPTNFRRTISTGAKEPVVLIFVPGKHYDLTKKEIECVQDLIDTGLLVQSNCDPKGRHKDPKPASAEANEVISKLEKKVQDQAKVISDQSTTIEDQAGKIVDLETRLEEFDGEPE